LEALQALFAQYCDKDGLMTKSEVEKIPSIAELFVSIYCVTHMRILETTAEEDPYML
jgi:hypothetical protein